VGEAGALDLAALQPDELQIVGEDQIVGEFLVFLDNILQVLTHNLS
jgi:hypothetical protein